MWLVFRIWDLFYIFSSFSYSINWNNLVFISVSILCWSICKTWVMVLWNRLYYMSFAFPFYLQNQCLFWNKRIIFPPGPPAKTTVNTSKIFWSKWCFITKYFCSKMYSYLLLSNHLSLVQSLSTMMSLVLHKLRGKKSTLKKYNYNNKMENKFFIF